MPFSWQLLLIAALSSLSGLTALLWWSGPAQIAPELLGRGIVPLSIGLGIGVLYLQIRPSRRLGADVVGAAHRVGETLRLICLFFSVSLLLFCFSVVATPFTGSLADPILAWPEEAIGCRQVDALDLARRAGLIDLLQMAYDSYEYQLVAVFGWWGLARGRYRPLQELAVSYALCGAIGGMIYLHLPAAGPSHHYPWTGPVPGFLNVWWRLRDWEPVLVSEFDGFVAAPSFHTVGAVLLARLWWATPFRIPGLMLNALMLAATWVIGCHYLADMALGLALVGLVLASLRWSETVTR